MSNRSGAVGGMRRHSGLGPLALMIFVMIWTGASVDVRADIIILKDGEDIEGSIVDATRNTVIMRRSIGGMRQMRIQDIDEVRIDVARREQISGRFLSWADGVYQLRSGDEVIRIREGVILGREQAIRQPSRELSSSPEEQLAAGTSVAQTTPPADEPAAPIAEGESQTVAIKASVDPAETGADAMVFRIELSHPAEQPIVLIYGTSDGSAKAGKDYEQRRGVITLAPGAESGEVHVPLIEDEPSKGDKRFELFLIADPKIAEVVNQRISATIHADD
jgi:Calx-beta domain